MQSVDHGFELSKQGSQESCHSLQGIIARARLSQIDNHDHLLTFYHLLDVLVDGMIGRKNGVFCRKLVITAKELFVVRYSEVETGLATGIAVGVLLPVADGASLGARLFPIVLSESHLA